MKVLTFLGYFYVSLFFTECKDKHDPHTNGNYITVLKVTCSTGMKKKIKTNRFKFSLILQLMMKKTYMGMRLASEPQCDCFTRGVRGASPGETQREVCPSLTFTQNQDGRRPRIMELSPLKLPHFAEEWRQFSEEEARKRKNAYLYTMRESGRWGKSEQGGSDCVRFFQAAVLSFSFIGE